MYECRIRASRGSSKELPVECCNFMKLALACASALLVSLLWVSPLAAQANESTAASPQTSEPQNTAPTPQPAPTHPAHSAHRRPTLDDRVKAFAKALDLSEPQQAAVRRVLEQRQA